MTNDLNMDEFDQEDLGAPGVSSGGSGDSVKKKLLDAWRTQPLFKLMVIMIGVGIAIAGALGVFSSPPPAPPSKVVSAPGISEPPGGKASPYFIDQNQQANADRVDQAMQQGGSAMPTPVGQNLDLGDINNKKKEDPLAEFRAETERLKQEMTQERQQNAQQMQVMQQQIQQKPIEKEDDTLAQAMQRQMQQLMEAWAPRNIKVVEGMASKDKTSTTQSAPIRTVGSGASASAAAATSASTTTSRLIVQAGTVNYAQLLTEANSDIPGPILAQVLSGPLSGGRAIGHFQAMNDFLVIQFNLINYKGKDYSVNILALDPDTTLGGMATEVDHRYFDRILLPAAAAFASQFGSTMGQGSSTTTVTDNAVVIDQAKSSYRQAIFSGFGNAAQSLSQFLQQEASQIKPLIRVATGTPMGLFFLTSVSDQQGQQGQGLSSQQINSWFNPSSSNAWMNQRDMSGNYYMDNQGTSTAVNGVYPNGALSMGSNPTAGGYYSSTRLPGSSLTVITPNQTRY